MKGMSGVMIALGLGVLGAAANWVYVANQGAQVATLSFVGIKNGTRIDVGQTFRDEQFEPVDIPRNRAGNLEDHAVKWSARQTLYGYPASRNFTGGELVLVEDTRTTDRRTAAEKIGRDEVAKGVKIDTGTFVSRLINPGDRVAFTLTNPGGSGPNRTKTIGPFRVLYLGDRGSSTGVARAAGSSGSAESIMTIAVKMKNPPEKGSEDSWDGEFDGRARELFDLIESSGDQAAEISLFSDKMSD